VDAGLDQAGGDERRRAADRAGGVDPEQGLAHRADGLREVELGHHHALEEVGRLAEDDGVDVGPGHLGVLQGLDHRLPHEAGDRDVAAGGLVLRLADADDRDALLAHQSLPSRTHTRFCCRHGPLVAWATARRASPRAMRAAASPMRIRPAAMSGLAASGPPGGLTTTPSPRPSARRWTTSWRVHGAWREARSRGPSATPARSAASAVEGEAVRSRTPRAWASMRWSIPRIHTGRSVSSRARSPAARTTAAAPSLIGGQSWRRSGGAISGSSSRTDGSSDPRSWATGLLSAARRLRAATSAISSTVVIPASRQARACRAARATLSGHRGAT